MSLSLGGPGGGGFIGTWLPLAGQSWGSWGEGGGAVLFLLAWLLLLLLLLLLLRE